MMKAWEKNIRKVVPYVPGEQPNKERMIKLNTNENPYPPAPGVAEALKNLDPDRLRLYPDPACTRLVDAIAKQKGLKSEQIFVGVGSDDVLAMCFMTFFNSEKPILFPDITYSFYDVWAEEFRIPYETQPLDDDFNIRKEDYYKENGGVIFPNPNAPTGVEASQEMIEDILQHNQDVIVIIDEAYVDFGARTAQPLLEKYDNLIVVQTFSKSRSMAGMRIGYAMASPELIKYLNDVKYSFNSYTMDQTALDLGVASIEDQAYFEETLHKIIQTRERVKLRLTELGFTFRDSRSNFIFASHKSCPAEELFEKEIKELENVSVQADEGQEHSDQTNQGKTVAFFYITSKGSANVRKPGDYVAKMITMAGGTYVPQSAEEEEENALSTMNMEMEAFYAKAKDADYIIYNSTIDGELTTIDEFLAKSPLLADFKAVKEGHVWCTGKNLFQETMGLGNMIQDIHRMLTEETPDEGQMHYIHQLK